MGSVRMNYRDLEIAIAKALGYNIKTIDAYVSEFMESTRYQKEVIDIGNDDYDEIPYFTKDASAIMGLTYIMHVRGWIFYMKHLSTGDYLIRYKLYVGNKLERDCIIVDEHEFIGRCKCIYLALTGGEWESEGE